MVKRSVKASTAKKPRAKATAKGITVLKPTYEGFNFWLVGDTPLIVHAWSEKARRAMLDKQMKVTKPKGKPPRDPDADYMASMYDMGDGIYGFPVTGIKKCILSSAHKDKGVAKTDTLRSLFLDAVMVRVRPARAGAICDMPLTTIYGSDPEMREDMVRIGAGMKRTADLSYRAQYTVWAMHITGRFNPNALSLQALGYLIEDSGIACGLGEWRNERHGVFGSFHLASEEEARLWTAYAEGKGELPVPSSYKMAAE